MKAFSISLDYKILTIASIIFTLIIIAASCNSGPPKNSRAAQAIAGKALFSEQCASCHGGPEMSVNQAILDTLETIPPDLTKINYRRGAMEFPVAEIARIIDGRLLSKAHGPREMPVWGQVYEEGGMEEGEIKGKKGELVAYLMSIQASE